MRALPLRRTQINIFIIGFDPSAAAQYQCDKHVVKMILESAQMLSTAHRILDGKVEKRPSKSGKRLINYWVHPTADYLLYKAVHENHPCTKWVMASGENYRWLYDHFLELCYEYEHRYGRTHASMLKLRDVLYPEPKNIPNVPKTPFAQAMPDEFKDPQNPVSAYRAYYQSKQDKFAMKWTNRLVPDWFKFND